MTSARLTRLARSSLLEVRSISFMALRHSLLVLFILSLVLARVSAEVPAIYAFGDSLIDPGNNRYLLTTAQAGFPPNGINFAGSEPTGRFCNGLMAIDLIAQELNIPLLPPYHDPSTRGSIILKGVNYASGGARVSNEPGIILSNVEPLGKQLDNFVSTKSQLADLLGNEAATLHLSNSLLSFTFGSNDYLNFVNAINGKSPQQFQDELVSSYQQYLRNVYLMGGRKIVVIGIGPLGCIPSRRLGNIFGANGGGCDTRLNELVVNANAALLDMVKALNQQLPGLKMVFGNIYDLSFDVANNPAKYGFTTKSACCGVSPLKLFACIPGGSVCANRSTHMFWDAFHPTEATNRIIVKSLMDGDSSVMYAINIRQLAQQ